MHLLKLNFICPALGGYFKRGFLSFYSCGELNTPMLVSGFVLFTVCSFCIRRQLLQIPGTKDRPYLGGS